MPENEYIQVIAFDIGGTKVAGGFVMYPLESESNGVYTLRNEAPRVLAYSTMPTRAHAGGDQLLANLTDFVRGYIDLDRGPLMGIGVD